MANTYIRTTVGGGGGGGGGGADAAQATFTMLNALDNGIVADYAGDPDTATDNRPALASLIVTAQQFNLPIYFPAGLYYFSFNSNTRGIAIDSSGGSLTMVGDGGVGGATFFKIGTNALLDDTSYGVWTGNGNSLTIEGIKFSGPQTPAATTAIGLFHDISGGTVTLKDVSFHNFVVDVKMDGGPYTLKASESRFEASNSGWLLNEDTSGSTQAYAYATDCQFKTTGAGSYHCLYINPGINYIVDGCDLEESGTTGFGVHCYGTSIGLTPVFQIIRNTLFRAVLKQVLIGTKVRTLISDCQFVMGDVNAIGIITQAGPGALVSNCIFKGTTGAGISELNSTVTPFMDVVGCVFDGAFDAGCVYRQGASGASPWNFRDCRFNSSSTTLFKSANTVTGQRTVFNSCYFQSTTAGVGRYACEAMDGTMEFYNCEFGASVADFRIEPLYGDLTLRMTGTKWYNTTGFGIYAITGRTVTIDGRANEFLGATDRPGFTKSGTGVITGMFRDTVGPSQAAAGATQATATATYTSIIRLDTVAAGTGVSLPSLGRAGDVVTYFNQGANTVTIYPLTGGSINGVVNATRTCAAGAVARFQVQFLSGGALFWVALQ